MYRLVVCDRPGCSKLHKVVPAPRSGAGTLSSPGGNPPLSGSQDPTPASDQDTVSLPLLDGFWGSQARVEDSAGSRPAR